MKRSLLLVLSMWSTLPAFAQEATAVGKSFFTDPINDPMLPYYVTTALLFLAIVLVTFVGIYMMRVINILTQEAKKEQAKISGAPSPGWWERFTQRMNASVPVEQEKHIELDHSFDGIKELDNHLPPWWKWLFYGTIVWAVVYIVVFHFSNSLPLSLEEYQQEIAWAEQRAQEHRAAQPESVIDENTLQYSADAAIIEKGKAVFANNPCGSCHRHDGGGNTIGPNLTDEYWIHGGDVKHIFNTIKNGVVEKGMPAWGKVMSPQEIRDVTFFIISLKGTNPANAKAPQGERFKQTTTVLDTTATASTR